MRAAPAGLVTGLALTLVAATASAQGRWAGLRAGAGEEGGQHFCPELRSLPRGPHGGSRAGSHRPEKISARSEEPVVNSVSKGKNKMPPCGDVLDAGDIDALWAYGDGRREALMPGRV
jgi:hypothetical protein